MTPELIFYIGFGLLALYSIRAAIHDAGEKIAQQIAALREEFRAKRDDDDGRLGF